MPFVPAANDVASRSIVSAYLSGFSEPAHWAGCPRCAPRQRERKHFVRIRNRMQIGPFCARALPATTETVPASCTGAGRRSCGVLRADAAARRQRRPDHRVTEAAVAKREGGSHALATSSGMEAVSTVYLGLLSVGDRVVCGDSAYGPWRVVCVALGR
jgi:hypothetical protein